MVGWIIFGSILLLLGILLSLSITFRVQYDDDLTITVGVGKFRYTLVPVSQKEETDVKKDSKKVKKGIQKEQKKVNPKAKKKVEKGDVKEMVFLALDMLKSVLMPMRKLLSRVRITALSVDITVGGEDAAETAVLYGKISALVYGGLATLRNLMTVKVGRVAINCNFLQDHIDQKVFFKIKVRVLFAVWAVLRMACRLLVHTFRRAKKNAADKKEESQNGPENVPAKRESTGDNRRK